MTSILIIIALLGLAAGLGVQLWRRTRAAAANKPVAFDAGAVSASMATLYSEGDGRSRYDMPCVLMCGAAKAGKSNVLRGAGMQAHDAQPGKASGWWRSIDGVVFELPENDTAADGGLGLWRDALSLLLRERFQRPLDAVVWTIPLAVLMADAAKADDAKTDDALAKTGIRMSERLYELQSRLGQVVPVYVIVSQCDAIPGFGLFAAKLAAQPRLAHLCESPIGWSNPYSLGTTFQKKWAEAGIGEIIGQLRENVCELGAERDLSFDFNQIFLLPDQLAAALARLPTLLQYAFRQNASLDNVDCRSIHLTGTPPPPPVEDAPEQQFQLAPEAGPGAPADFCRKLFIERIFGEFGLAKPVRRKLIGTEQVRDKILIGSAVLAAALCIGLFFVHKQASEQARTMQLPLARLKTELLKPEAQRTQTDTVELLKLLDAVPQWSLKSVLMPLSYLPSGLDARVRGALRSYYKEALLKSIDVALAEKASEIIEWQPAAQIGSEEIATEPTQMPGFINFNDFVDKTVLFESNLNRFHHVISERQGNRADVSGLLAYLFQLQDATQSPEAERVFSEIINEISYTEATPDQDEVLARKFQQRLLQLHEAWMNTLFRQNKLAENSKKLTTALQAFNAGQLGALTEMDKLQQDIVTLNNLLARTNMSWMANGNASLGEGYVRAQKKISASQLLGTQHRTAALAKSAALAREQFSDEVVKDVRDQGAVLDYVPGKGLILKSDILEFQGALLALIHRPLMQGAASEGEPGAQQQRDVLLEWDADTLDAAAAAEHDYLSYEEGQLPKTPARFQQALGQTARDSAGALIDRNIGRAAVPASAQRDWHTANFDQAQRQILPLLASMRKFGHAVQAAKWEHQLSIQARRLLANIDARLDINAPLLPDKAFIAAWDGGRTSAWRAYAADQAELPGSLALQFAAVGELVEASKAPRMLLEKMKPAELEQAATLFAKWKKLETELQKYAAKNPAATPSVLEQLISDKLNDIDSGNCAPLLAKFARLRDGDYFQRRAVELIKLLNQRCGVVQAEATRVAYRAITDYYNATLRQRYPFAGPTDAEALDTTPEQVRQLLLLLDDNLIVAKAGLERLNNPASAEAIVFLGKLDRVRPLLAALLASDAVSAGPTQLDLALQFRVNRERELGADQIIDWSIDSGGAPTAGGLGWRLGDPINMRLRWANNSDFGPAPGPGRASTFQIDGKTASWKYDGPWALLKMLAEHAAPASLLSARDASAPQVLRMIVPTRHADGRPGADALVFARVGVSVHGKTERLSYAAFPSDKAPDLPTPSLLFGSDGSAR